MLNYKQNITNIPTYLDGKFQLYKINQSNNIYPQENLINLNTEIWFEIISISDKLKFELKLNQREQKIYIKIRIPQMKQIGSLHAIKIDNVFYKVFNAYHFTNNDGYPQTDLTLEEYPNPIVIENND